MTLQRICLFFINLFLISGIFTNINAQENSLQKDIAIQKSDSTTVSTDTIIYKNKFGIRVGADLSRFIISALDNQDQSVEFKADYRISKKMYLAVEFGNNNKLVNEDYYSFRTKGNYFKGGLNINMYQNWLDMQNEIYVGFRYGIASFSQTLLNYTINQDGTYFPQPEKVTTTTEYDNLSASWGEIIFGLKVETFKNLFMGVSISAKKLFNSKEPENANGFKNLYVPGFYRVFKNDSGIGFGYSLTYTIPLYKKDK